MADLFTATPVSQVAALSKSTMIAALKTKSVLAAKSSTIHDAKDYSTIQDHSGPELNFGFNTSGNEHGGCITGHGDYTNSSHNFSISIDGTHCNTFPDFSHPYTQFNLEAHYNF